MRIALVAVGVLLAAAPMAANWPQWRGPSGLGVSAESGLPTTWNERENIAWSAALRGLGSSSPIVWGNQVVVTSQIGRVPLGGGPHPALARDDAALVAREKPIGGRREESSGAADPIFLVVESFDRSDGRRVWEYRVEARGPFPNLHEKHNLATPTAVTNGEQIFAWFGTGQVVALDMRGGVVWSKHLGEEVRAVRHQLGTRQLSGALQGPVDPAVRSPVGVVLDRARRADGKAALEGRPRKGPGIVQHAPGRAGPEWRRARLQFERAHRRLRSQPPASCAGTLMRRVRRRFPPPSFTTVSST